MDTFSGPLGVSGTDTVSVWTRGSDWRMVPYPPAATKVPLPKATPETPDASPESFISQLTLYPGK